MRIPLISLFMSSPFEALLEHAEKVKECAWAFQQAIECHVSERCRTFDELRNEVVRLESEADAIKRRIRGHIPMGTFMPVDKFQLFMYLREQDSVLDSVEDSLDWISYKHGSDLPEELEKDFILLVDACIDPIEELAHMVSEARKYFRNFSEKQRKIVKNIIRSLRKSENEADKVEAEIKRKALSQLKDPTMIYHCVRLSEIIGSIADHAENAGDMMRAMVAK